MISLLKGVAPSLDTKTEGVSATLRAFVPVLIGRGSVQISAYIDQIIAQLEAATTGRAMAIASSTLFWMPRASRSGATTKAACCR